MRSNVEFPFSSPHCSCFHLLLVCRSFCLHFFPQHLKSMLHCVEIRRGSLKNIQFLAGDPWLLPQFVSGHFKLLPLQYCISQSSKHGPVHLRIYAAITISTHVISKHQRPVTTTVTHTHVIRLPLPGLTDDLACICLLALTFSFPNFSFMLF